MVEVGDLGVGVTSRSYPKGAILKALKMLKRGVANVWGPDSGCVIEGRFYIDFVRAQQRFLIASPAGAGEGAENSSFASYSLDNVHDVRVKAEVGVKTHPQDTRRLVKGNRRTLDENLRMRLRLAGLVRGEVRDGALVGSDTEPDICRFFPFRGISRLVY